MPLITNHSAIHYTHWRLNYIKILFYYEISWLLLCWNCISIKRLCHCKSIMLLKLSLASLKFLSSKIMSSERYPSKPFTCQFRETVYWFSIGSNQFSWIWRSTHTFSLSCLNNSPGLTFLPLLVSIILLMLFTNRNAGCHNHTIIGKKLIFLVLYNLVSL